MSTGKLIAGILVGAAAGALIGVLFAPDKGSETRKKIMRKGEDYKDAVNDTFNDIMDKTSEKFDSMKEKVDDFMEKGKSKISDVKKNVNTTMN
jgi:gas vesicle protein